MPGPTIILIVTLVVMAVGLIGSALPALPGVPLIFVAALVYSYLTDFEMVGAGVLVLLGVLALLALVADFIGTAYGARRFGASPWGTAGGAIGGIVGAIIGAFFLGLGAIVGLILGSVGGVFAGEYLRRRRREPESSSNWRGTSRAAGGVLVGYVISAVAQGVMGVISVAVFVVAVIY